MSEPNLTHIPTMHYPDEPLPSLQVSLKTFVSAAQKLWDDDRHHDFARFMYAGRLAPHPDDVQHRVFVNARQDIPALPVGEYEIRRDFDSAIGITRTLPFLHPLAVFPMASFEDTLKKDNHVTAEVPSQLDGSIHVPLHKIPNVALGKVQRRHVTRIFFPRLYRQERSPAISQTTLATIYDRCLRPAVVHVNALDQSHWPISYAAAMIQNRGPFGRFHYSSVDIPSFCLGRFAEKLLALLDEQEDLKDAFFVHELRGTKGASLHNPANQWEREQALDEQLAFLDTEELDLSDWTVDVALEIRHAGRIVQWLTSAHRQLLQFVLPSARDGQITAILGSKKQYKCDLSAQLQELGGCRVTPGSRGKADRVSYINIYTTDKSATYQLHHGIFKRRQACELFPNAINKLLNDIEQMEQVFRQCGGADIEDDVQEGCGHLEVRVPMRLANSVLLNLADNLVQQTAVSYECNVWWFFKLYRLMALHYIIKQLQHAKPAARIWRPSLELGAITIYQLNALIYRPGEDPAELQLVHAASQHIPPHGSEESNDDGDETTPILYNRGLYFMSDLVLDKKAYRLPASRPIDTNQLAILYRQAGLKAIEQEFNIVSPTGVEPPPPNQAGARRSKITKTLDLRYLRDSTEEVEFNLEARGVAVKPKMRMTGEDIRHSDSGSDQDREDETIDKLVTNIFHQFPYDVLQVAPNCKNRASGSWTIMDADARADVTIDIFKTLDLSAIFEKVQYRIVEWRVWKEVIFARYFSEKGRQRPRGLQNFPAATYYRDWIDLMNRLKADDARLVRHEVFKKFNKLHWVPYAGSDRMWPTKVMTTGGWRMMPAGQQQACPHIAVNEKWYRG